MLDLGVKVTYGIAFFSGVASFMSPCLLPMIPAYILYMVGNSKSGSNGTQGEPGKISRRMAIFRTLAFISGFTVVFMLLGLSASAAGAFFSQNKELFQRVGGGIIILLGLQFLGVFKMASLSKQRRIKLPFKEDSYFGALLMGLAFGAGWTPCFGPVLAAIIVMASNAASSTQGTALLFVYAMGLGIPFILTALFINEITPVLSRWERSSAWINKLAGGFLVIFGILMLMDWLVKLNYLWN